MLARRTQRTLRKECGEGRQGRETGKEAYMKRRSLRKYGNTMLTTRVHQPVKPGRPDAGDVKTLGVPHRQRLSLGPRRRSQSRHAGNATAIIISGGRWPIDLHHHLTQPSAHMRAPRAFVMAYILPLSETKTAILAFWAPPPD